MKEIMKRDGTPVLFDGEKIRIAVRKANSEVEEGFQLKGRDLEALVKQVYDSIGETIFNVEDVQNYALDYMEGWNYHTLRDIYANYRDKRAFLRDHKNTTDDPIESLLTLTNKENENANKDAVLVSTQGDLIAGEVSKDIARRKMIPQNIIKAHDEGIIHIHDMDYLARKMYNCCLVNLEDMLQNGTVINKKMIEKPKSFKTACTISTQIVAQVASAQFGGQTISLAHISPFVEVSRQKIRDEVRHEFMMNDIGLMASKIESIVEQRLAKEIKDGVQTIQYQLETLSSTNG